MGKKLRSFPQHSEETCGISCLLMVLDYHSKDHPTIKLEKTYYNKYRAKTYAGTTGAAIAKCLKGKQIPFRLLHESPNLLENHGRYFPPAMHADLLKEYRDVLADYDVTPETGCTLTCDSLKQLLEEGNTVFLQTLVPGTAVLSALQYNETPVSHTCPELDLSTEVYPEDLEEQLEKYQDLPMEHRLRYKGFLNLPITLYGTARELLDFLHCGKILHWILAYGYEDGKFLLCDPHGDPPKFTYTPQELEPYLDNPFGRLWVAVKNP